MIKNFRDFVNESLSESVYEIWELGVIKAWGHLLYLSYHDTPNKISNIVTYNETIQIFKEYFYESDDDEDLRDWMSDCPPMSNGIAIFDKNRLSEILSNIANKTKLKNEMIVYRYGKINSGWNSYLTEESIAYSGQKHRFKLPKEFPIIFTFGYADKNEVIVNLSDKDTIDFTF